MDRTTMRRLMLSALVALALTIGPSVGMVWAEEVDRDDGGITMLDGSVCYEEGFCISFDEPVIIGWETDD